MGQLIQNRGEEYLGLTPPLSAQLVPPSAGQQLTPRQQAEQLTRCNSDAIQTIRLFVDVLFLGPFLIWLGLTPDTRLPPLLRSLLVVSGVGTIVFNGVNFLLIESRRPRSAIGGVGGRELGGAG